MKTLILALALAAAALAQSTPTCNSATIPVCNTPGLSGTVQTKPMAVPTSATSVAVSDAYLDFVVISASSTVTITITDGNSISVLPAVSIAAGSVYTIDLSGYWCPKGFTITASGTGATFYARWRQ